MGVRWDLELGAWEIDTHANPDPLLKSAALSYNSPTAEYDAAMNVHLRPDTALPEGVKIGAGQGGLPRLEISTPSATAEIYLHGAHVTRWQPSHAETPVLWVSEHSLWQDGKPIRGGVPICFPWFGPHRSDPGGSGTRLRPPGRLDAGRRVRAR